MKRLVLIIVGVLVIYSAFGQSFEKFKLTGTEIPEGYTTTEEMFYTSIQPQLYYEEPDMYESILGTLKSKGFQSFRSKKDKGTILFFEYENEVEAEGFLDGLLWGGDKPTSLHPEEYLVKDNILIIWCFPRKSALKTISQKKIKEIP